MKHVHQLLAVLVATLIVCLVCPIPVSAQQTPAQKPRPTVFDVTVAAFRGDGSSSVEALLNKMSEQYKFSILVESPTPGLNRVFRGTIPAGTLNNRITILLQFARAYPFFETQTLLIYGSLEEMQKAMMERPYQSLTVTVPPPAPKQPDPPRPSPPTGPPPPQSNITDTLVFSPAQTCVPSRTSSVKERDRPEEPRRGFGGIYSRTRPPSSYTAPPYRAARTWRGIPYFEDLLYEDHRRQLDYNWTTGLVKIKGREEGGEEFLKRVSVVAFITNPDCTTTVVNVINAAEGNSKLWDDPVKVPIQNGVTRLVFILEDGSGRPPAFGINQLVQPLAVSDNATPVVVMPENFQNSRILYDLRQHVMVETETGQIIRR